MDKLSFLSNPASTNIVINTCQKENVIIKSTTVSTQANISEFNNKSASVKNLSSKFPSNNSCDSCEQNLQPQEHLETHNNNAHEEESFICEHCGLNFITDDLLETHIKTEHEEDSTNNLQATYPCNSCGQMFLSQDLIEAHIKLSHSTL